MRSRPHVHLSKKHVEQPKKVLNLECFPNQNQNSSTHAILKLSYLDSVRPKTDISCVGLDRIITQSLFLLRTDQMKGKRVMHKILKFNLCIYIYIKCMYLQSNKVLLYICVFFLPQHTTRHPGGLSINSCFRLKLV